MNFAPCSPCTDFGLWLWSNLPSIIIISSFTLTGLIFMAFVMIFRGQS